MESKRRKFSDSNLVDTTKMQFHVRLASEHLVAILVKTVH